MDKSKREFHDVGSLVSMKILNLFPYKKLERFMEKFARKTFETGQFVPKLSNLGILPPDSLNFNQVPINDAYLIVPINHPPRLLLAVSSFREAAYFSLGYDDAEFVTPVVGEFFELMESELKKVGVNEFITMF